MVLLLIHSFISSFYYLSNFQTLQIFVTLFSGTVRPRRWKLNTRVDIWQMYRVYRIQAAASYLSLYSVFLLSNFQALKIFVTLFSGTVRPRRLKLGCVVYTGIRLLLLICPFISSFFFLPNFQTLKFSSHFSLELWGLEDWNFVHTWTVGSCIVYTGIRLLLLICPILHFSFSPIFKHCYFLSHFSQELWGLDGWNLVHTWIVDRWIM